MDGEMDKDLRISPAAFSQLVSVLLPSSSHPAQSALPNSRGQQLTKSIEDERASREERTLANNRSIYIIKKSDFFYTSSFYKE
jgi:hypothetical protein